MNPESTGAYLRTIACVLWGVFIGGLCAAPPQDNRAAMFIGFIAFVVTGVSIAWGAVWSKSS